MKYLPHSLSQLRTVIITPDCSGPAGRWLLINASNLVPTLIISSPPHPQSSLHTNNTLQMSISRLMKSCCSALKGGSTPQHLALLSFGQWASSFIKPGQNKNTIECFFHPIDRWEGLYVTMTWANSPAQMSNCKPAIRKISEWLWPFSYSLWQLLLSLSICFKCSLSFSWFSNVIHIKTPELKHAPHCKCHVNQSGACDARQANLSPW